jgi:hypothetical protein
MYKKESLKKRKRNRTDQRLEMDGEPRDHSRVRYAVRVMGASHNNVATNKPRKAENVSFAIIGETPMPIQCTI